MGLPPWAYLGQQYTIKKAGRVRVLRLKHLEDNSDVQVVSDTDVEVRDNGKLLTKKERKP